MSNPTITDGRTPVQPNLEIRDGLFPSKPVHLIPRSPVLFFSKVKTYKTPWWSYYRKLYTKTEPLTFAKYHTKPILARVLGLVSGAVADYNGEDYQRSSFLWVKAFTLPRE